MAIPEKYSHISFVPPAGVRREAARGLAMRREHGRGGTAIGIARARDLSNGTELSPSTLRRMKAFFDRHAPDRKATGFRSGEEGFPSNGKIADLLWGGRSGEAWANKVVRQMNAADERTYSLDADTATLEEEAVSQRSALMSGVERRYFGSFEKADSNSLTVEHRADPETGKRRTYIVGYAAKFGTDSLLLGDFIERLEPTAFDIVKAGKDKSGKPIATRCLFNHDPNHLLGRFPTTMKLIVDKIGLRYECLLPESRMDIAESIARGDLKGSSFSFVIDEDGGEKWITENGQSIRLVRKIKSLLDVSPVTYPAYDDATVAIAKRSYENYAATSQTIVVPKVNFDAEIKKLRDFYADRRGFCATGEGGGIDNSCGASQKGVDTAVGGAKPSSPVGGTKSLEQIRLEAAGKWDEAKKDMKMQKAFDRHDELQPLKDKLREKGISWSVFAGKSAEHGRASGLSRMDAYRKSLDELEKGDDAFHAHLAKLGVKGRDERSSYEGLMKFYEERAFCATGPGGGIDNSCGSSSSGDSKPQDDAGAGIHTDSPAVAAAAGAGLGTLAGIPGAVIGGVVGLAAGLAYGNHYVSKVESALKAAGSSVSKLDAFAKAIGKSLSISLDSNGVVDASDGGVKVSLYKFTKSEGGKLAGKVAMVEGATSAIGGEGTESVIRLAETLAKAGRALGVDHLAVSLDTMDRLHESKFEDAGFTKSIASDDATRVTMVKSYRRTSKRYDELMEFFERRAFCPTGSGGGIDNSCGKFMQMDVSSAGSVKKSAKDAQDFIDKAREEQLSKGGKDGGQADEGGGVQTWSKGDHFPWTVKQVGDTDGHVQGQHPDGSKTEKYPFKGGDTSEAMKKVTDEIKRRKGSRADQVVADTLKFLKDRRA